MAAKQRERWVVAPGAKLLDRGPGEVITATELFAMGIRPRTLERAGVLVPAPETRKRKRRKS